MKPIELRKYEIKGTIIVKRMIQENYTDLTHILSNIVKMPHK